MRMLVFVCSALIGRTNAVALTHGAPSLRFASRCSSRGVMLQDDEPTVREEPSVRDGGSEAGPPAAVDLSTLDFEQRLEVLASRIPETAAAQVVDDNVFPEGSPETNFWSPKFWSLCSQDLQEIVWPSSKQVFQTLFISQIAFVVIIALTLVFDAMVESGVKTLLLGEPFSLTVDKIMKLDPK